MSVSITVGNDEYTLTNVEYWGQRLFAKATCHKTGETSNVISTKGFDHLLIASNRGNKFKFKGSDKYNPYLANKEKDIYYESQLIDKHGEQYEVTDVGPSEYNGTYRFWFKLGEYNDDYYFETRKLQPSDFNLFQYQTDDIYYTTHASSYRDKLPTLFSGSDADLFGKINIIHGVTFLNDKVTDIFDVESIDIIVTADTGYAGKDGIYLIARSTGYKGMFNYRRIGVSNFCLKSQLEVIKNDCGDSYIKKNFLRKFSRKSHALRYLYEYFHNLNNMTKAKRQHAVSTQTGSKEFKKEEFIPVFTGINATEFKIVYFKNIFTIEKKVGLSRVISGDDTFAIHGSYNYESGTATFDEFESRYELLSYVKKNVSVDASIKLATVCSKWLPDTLGYIPRTMILPCSKRANASPVVDKLVVYCLPIIFNEHITNEDVVYVNLYNLLGMFGLHNLKIRNILRMNEFSEVVYDILNYRFDVYHVSKDIRRPVFNWDNDADLSDCMISLNDAISIIYIFAESGEKKNSYWYSNANMLIQSFPDAKFDQDEASHLYMPTSLKNFVENQE